MSINLVSHSHSRPIINRAAAPWSLSSLLTRRNIFWAICGISVVACTIEYFSIYQKTTEAREIVDRIPTRPESVGVLSCWRHQAFKAVDDRGRSRTMWHPMMTIIPALHDGQSWGKGDYPKLSTMSAQERAFVEDLVASFVYKNPTLLLVDIDPPTPSMPGFDYIDYFSADPRFANAMANYEFESINGHFRVYRRRDVPSNTKLSPKIETAASASHRAQYP